MKWFHKHAFDSSKWNLVLHEEMFGILDPFDIPDDEYGKPGSNLYLKGHKYTYSNTCEGCGDLIFRVLDTSEY